MLSTPGTHKNLVSPDFIYEPKLDGVRAFLRKENGKVTLINRKGRDITARYPELQKADNIKADNCLLDGELIVYNKRGIPDFHLLMKRDQLTNPLHIRHMSIELPAIYVAFDVVEVNNKDFSNKPLLKRKELLSGLLTDNEHIQKMYYTTDGLSLWDFIMAQELEGVMAKRKDSPYLDAKRSDNWLKIKNFKTQDCIIVGYSSSGARALSALGLAAYDNGVLRFLGKVGTGFTLPFLESLLPRLQKNIIPEPSFSYPARYKDMVWVEPKMACEVQYLEFGPEGMLRNPSFMRMRPDKPLKDCIIELPRRRNRQAEAERLFQRKAS